MFGIQFPKNLSNQDLSYKVSIQEYNGSLDQLFKLHKTGTDDEHNDVFYIVSVQYPTLHLSLSHCAENADILLQKPNENAIQHQKWVLKGRSIVNLCATSEVKKGSLSIDMTGATHGDSIQANIKSDDDGQKWTVKTNNVVLSRVGYGDQSETNANQTWIPHFFDSGYDLGIHPGFPGAKDTCDGKECLSSTHDPYLAKDAMRICDESMSFLVGTQLSVGTLKAIADSIEDDGAGAMPGFCCMDIATNSEFWGYDVSRDRER